MPVSVEFFGIPRQRSGVPACHVVACTLGEALAALVERFPDLAVDCVAEGALAPNCVANLNGRRFVADPGTPLVDGDALLLLSADVGG